MSPVALKGNTSKSCVLKLFHIVKMSEWYLLVDIEVSGLAVGVQVGGSGFSGRDDARLEDSGSSSL